VASETPSYLSADELIDINRRVIGRYGGIFGVRDSGALESCVAQPKTHVFETERFPTVFNKAAAYCYYLVRLHPFLDGNKRTGLVAALTYLFAAGFRPMFSQDQMYDLIIGIAKGEIEVEELAEFISQSCMRVDEDPVSDE
jgi:death on curing protein